MTCRIELPVATEFGSAGWARAMDELTEGTSLDWEVIAEHGESGGWPEVCFSGTRDDLLKLLARYDPGDDSSLAQYITGGGTT